MTSYFQGYYYKHQKGSTTICFIAGQAEDSDFIQIITNDKVFHYNSRQGLKITSAGIWADLPQIKGHVQYGQLSPLGSHIMGPFHYLPMQCSHSVSSMYHSLSGSFTVEGELFDFTGGQGYIEGDRGHSFPKKYLWLHCNDFQEPLSIMASVADIPFMGIHFMGCICAILYRGQEYRLATYRGVRIRHADSQRLILTQGRYRLEVNLIPCTCHPLKSPLNGKMTGVIHESNCTKARFRFWKSGHILFDSISENTSFECNL